MSEKQNLEIVRNVYAAFGRGDLAGILAQLDPHVSLAYARSRGRVDRRIAPRRC
jgi:ketosteroid isomerase-like protein